MLTGESGTPFTCRARPAGLHRPVYGHALDAVRSGHRGADSVSVLMRFDLEKMGYVQSE